ncbi:SsrA-binding protein [Spiroplasma sp. TIUS-1]|uniref:SsrA-binding protein SmpB n=1 Tax=Spiroplasma sp. TIUS-1 TaxID=216963 RepID=UPI0013990152|nr:SsrA-binding protein SmpB [Spiroplasma sp. TIUS-1]QHX35625.1 SsrA-binding protein [Spiroplasma sp. TIUS-1]
MAEKIIALNKKAKFNYEILDTYEAGISLLGSEIKSIRVNGASIVESYILMRKGKPQVLNMNIPKYEFSTQKGHEPTRTRNLLLNASEIEKWSKKIQEDRLTVVPLKLYLKEGLAKLEIGLGRGKNTVDKRETIKTRDISRRLNNIKK